MAKGIDFIKSIANTASKTKNTTILEGNKAINEIKSLKDNPEEYFSGVKSLWNNQYNVNNYSKTALNKAGVNIDKGSNIIYDGEQNMTNLTWANKLKLAHLNKDGTWNKKAIAGSALMGYTGLSSVGRLASGGGLYKDSDGNFDIIGLPII
ncbi:hypothetical protein [Megamonas hypermegale]|uniref:hypothetical protein n=1 Tax=Megamonas hypermegale TaxID=158847 RepID=UPI00195613DD|nr:hypothetical protein [Megamonas hypermegale]MBM6761662.1 hypothetical protein [Megamonas hypermegale]